MILDLDALHASDPSLYAAVSITLGPAKGQLQVALADFPLPTRRRLSDWWVSQRQQPDPAAAAVTVVDKPAPPPRDYGAEEHAALIKDISETRAVSRLKEWGAAGLEDTKNNADLIRDFVNNSAVKGYWSPEIVDAAVANLGPKGSNRLTWKAKEPPAPEPPPAEPTEVIESWQLPIDADEYAMKKASVKALLDLNLRRRKLTNQMVVGRNHRGFGSTF